MKRTSILLTLMLATGLAGCATKQSVLTIELTRAGLDPQRSTCVGEYMGSRLSITQLQTLGRAVRETTGGADLRTIGAADLVRIAARVGDPRTIEVTGAAALRCGVV